MTSNGWIGTSENFPAEQYETSASKEDLVADNHIWFLFSFSIGSTSSKREVTTPSFSLLSVSNFADGLGERVSACVHLGRSIPESNAEKRTEKVNGSGGGAVRVQCTSSAGRYLYIQTRRASLSLYLARAEKDLAINTIQSTHKTFDGTLDPFEGTPYMEDLSLVCWWAFLSFPFLISDKIKMLLLHSFILSFLPGEKIKIDAQELENKMG